MAAIAFHPFQLTNVHAARLEASRRPTRTGDSEEPTFGYRGPTGIVHVAGEVGFQCTVRIQVDIPVLGEEIFHGAVTLVAFFVTADEQRIAISNARAFARAQALYIVWPFARAYLDQLAMMAGVGVPPIPLLLVPRSPGPGR